MKVEEHSFCLLSIHFVPWVDNEDLVSRLVILMVNETSARKTS